MPGGCNKGNQCHYEHDRTGGGLSTETSPNVRRSQVQQVSKAPRGKCDFYWSTGSCRRAFQCRFQHELSPALACEKNKDAMNDAEADASLPDGSILPFLTALGLSNMTASGGDAFRGSSDLFDPQTTQKHLSFFLRENFRFNTPAQMCSFAKLLSSASSMNNSWKDEDGQLLLGAIASDNGRLRLSDILIYESVSGAAIYSARALSFQRGYLPIVQYLSSKFVIKSTLSHHVNALYAIVHNNLDRIIVNLEVCMTTLMAARTFKDMLSSTESSGAVVFGPLLIVLYEYLSRFKDALATHKELGPFVQKLNQWVMEWADGICGTTPTFDDVLTTPEQQHAREFVTNHIKDRVRRVLSIVEREQAGLDRSDAQRSSRNATAASQEDSKHLLETLKNFYEGPGEERREGPRHNNDFVDIGFIKIAPTDEELTSRAMPFLPANIPNAPHPFPNSSMQRLLDIQFRLLREELLAPLRTSVQVLSDDMKAPSSRKTQLSDLKKKRGGRYNYQDRQNSVMFNVYTNVGFSRIEMESRRGLVVELQLDAPPGSARSNKAGVRAAYWSHGKRLMMGGLIAVLWKHGEQVDVHLGALCSSSEKLAESAKASDNKLRVRVQFFDSAVNFKVLEHIRSGNKKEKETVDRLLVESSVMFESVRPFLESLKRVPETIPFDRYLPHNSSGTLSGIEIRPPAYSTVPGFAFKLGSLLHSENGGRGGDLSLVTTDPDSIAAARVGLSERSHLDPSQAEATVDALTREIGLIQGPPGTGKTFMGVELIRVLVENNVGPILLIAFTNHALDHMLASIVDLKITTDLVRLGGRTADESIKRYSIDELERTAGRSYLERAMPSEIRAIKEIEEELMKLLKRAIGIQIPAQVLLNHVSIPYPDHVTFLEEAPSWVRELHSFHGSNDTAGWKDSGKSGKQKYSDTSLYAFWKTAKDLCFLRDARLQKSNQTRLLDRTNRYRNLDMVDDRIEVLSSSEDGDVIAAPQDNVVEDASSDDSVDQLETVSNPTGVEAFFLSHNISEIPEEPVTDRPVETLLESDCCDVWSYSATERARLDDHWVSEYRESAYESQKKRFEALIERHSELREKQRNRDQEIRLNIMRNRKLVGCTTTGAAKSTSLLKGFGPRVMIVEEAGQVLESHVLGSLVESVDHLILIGDPLQLRPTLNNYGLSMDNPRGKELYRFDMSLMERLSSNGFPMSRLDVQRRMRPSISSLIRDTLYNGLVDNPLVLEYGSVRGMDKDVFFLTHGHQEHGGGDDSVSKHNPYEVSMIKDLVKYLLRQGCYSADGSIVVLCTYLGQLVKVRDALKGEMTVIIDERDQDALAAHEEETDADLVPAAPASVERVQVTQRVRIRSVDNYQGEEADIVILSLVRNSGDGLARNVHDIVTRRSKPNIGFLKSNNRTNVALSRAKHGLYILGNASDFSSQSAMWSSVVEQLEKSGSVGEALPIKCHRHPEDVRYVSEPGQLPRISPDGGCLRNCNERLSCGHNCPYKCHSDDENHRNVFCTQPCPRLCPIGHPCSKQCGEQCGKCLHPIRNVELPCGHVHKQVPCHQMDDLSGVICMVKVERGLPMCEHKVQLPCTFDVKKHKCEALCDGILPCCGNSCKAKCHSCQQPPTDPEVLQAVPRVRHRSHKCGKLLYCEHSCRGTCAADHKCLDECQEKCRQSCAHAQCKLPCSSPCTPCQEACTWSCPHYSCPVPCGSVCARLPCDLRCINVLSCGHQCPSVCGEKCADQLCLECSPKDRLSEIADFILQRSLSDLDPSAETLDELVITLPDCKHTFTVETLDGHCKLHEYYEQNERGTWRNLKSPAPGYKLPPTCPTCRRAIRSPRYGRVFKRADLDILERNVASKMAQSLHNTVDGFNSVDRTKLREDLRSEASTLRCEAQPVTEDQMKSREKARRKVLSNKEESPVSWDNLDPGRQLHGIQREIAHRWTKCIGQIRKSYREAIAVASARSAHLNAWESAFSSVYRQEIENAIQDPAAAPRYPIEYAMRIAKMKVGQSKPLADKRFCVEAIWHTVNIRFLLADIAQDWLKPSLLSGNLSSFRASWATFVSFILASCIRDAELALRIAGASESRKQMLRSKLLILNAKLEAFKFDFRLYRDALLADTTRDELTERVRKELEHVTATMKLERLSHRVSKRNKVADADFRDLFYEPADALKKEWEELELAIVRGSFYNPVSYEEKEQIVVAFMTDYDLTHSGHFYQCSNGHTFVIGDCGGAMQTAQCPECSERIGGSDHNLLSSNRRDDEFETIARAHGALESPWAWGR